MDDNKIEDDSKLPSFFITSRNIPYKDRIKMQSVWQMSIDASISSTVNVPNEFTVEDVMDLYLYAHDMKLKGITIYRDGCKRSGILTTNIDKKEKEDVEFTISNRNNIPWVQLLTLITM
jgi:ribonucleoside-diphosphate reductase alpha chain